MRFQLSSNGVLQLGHEALRLFAESRQVADSDTEAGGLLIGRLISGTADVVVDRATGPVPSDRRSRFYFVRARRPAQEAVDAAWASSAGTQNYIGDWHTHPEDDPSPSCIDRRDWRQIVRRSEFEQPRLVFIIVGRNRIKAWELGPNDDAPVELSAITQ